MTAPAPTPPPPEPADDDPELVALAARLARDDRRRRWLGRLFLTAVALLALGAVALWQADALRRLGRDLQARLAGTPGAGVDLPRLHAELLPAWSVAMAQAGAGERREIERKLRALRAAVEPDAVLAGLFGDLSALAGRPDKLRAEASRAFELAREWNRYLEPAGWRLDATIHPGRAGGPALVLKTYRILADVRVAVGATPVTALILQRADPLNVVETLLGHANAFDNRAVLLADRMTEAALEEVWPLLDPALDPAQRPEVRPFAAAVRAEVTAGLDAGAVAVLRRTASLRFGAEQARRGILERRACGSRFVLYRVPWRGLDARSVGRILQAASSDPEDECPGVRDDEARALAAASQGLGAAADLEPAVEALVAWLARGVVVHEARHVADQLQQRGLEQRLPCPGCGPELGTGARAELSAYLAQLAHGPAPVTELLHLCTLRGHDGDTARAIARILPALGAEACTQPPPDLAARAAALESAWFGRSEAVTWPADVPARIPVAKVGP